MPGVPPVPIPNTAVKPRAADGSRALGPARVGRCQVYGPVVRKHVRAFCFLVDSGPVRRVMPGFAARSGRKWKRKKSDHKSLRFPFPYPRAQGAAFRPSPTPAVELQPDLDTGDIQNSTVSGGANTAISCHPGAERRHRCRNLEDRGECLR
jgi:hypothetical protein